MVSFYDRLKGGLAGARDAFRPARYAVGGIRVKCSHCAGEEFAEGSAQLNTAALTFLDLDWANKSAHTLMCVQCSRIEWFGEAPEKLS
jgi:uncharacterized protein